MLGETNKPTNVFQATLLLLQAVSRGLLLVKYALVLAVVAGAAAAFGALSTATDGGLGVHFVGWLFGLIAAFGSALYGLRALRRRRHGDAPPRTPISPLDLMVDISGVIAGAGFLLLFAPDLVRANAGHMTTAAIGTALGACAIAKAAYEAYCYVNDP